MNWVLCVFILVMTWDGEALAASRTITFFSDGAVAEIEATAIKGTIEIPLPFGMIENTLRVRPMGETVIRRVDLLSLRKDPGSERELDRLLEHRSRLEDRLQALATREDIFKAAVRSQSSKAPRKTKTNPDPMQSIRQGTDFAIAQLEAVYTARRKTTRAIQHIDARIAELRKDGASNKTTARITVTPGKGRAKIYFAIADQAWKPCYDIRLSDEKKAVVTLYGQLNGQFPGYLRRIATAAFTDSMTPVSFPVPAGSFARLADFTLPMRDVQFSNKFATSFSSFMTNTSSVNLPAGEASLYRNGEYLGRIRFSGISSGRSARISSN